MGDEVVGPADIGAREFERLSSDLSGLCTEELGRLLEEFRPYLLAIALEEMPAALGAKLGASDLVQETMSRGFENAATFQGNTKEQLAGWLRSILLNHLANTIKSYQTEKRDYAREQLADSRVVHPGQISPSTEALNREQWDLLQAALSRLSDEYRQAILLRHRENLTFSEIGSRFGKSEEAARKIWTRAIKQLQQELQQHEVRQS